MKTMKWLLRREYWEHKGMLMWAPLAVGATMILFTLVMMLSGKNFEINGVSANSTTITVAGKAERRAQHAGGECQRMPPAQGTRSQPHRWHCSRTRRCHC